MKMILKYLKPHFLQMIVGFVIKFGGTIMDLLLPWILAYIIDEVVPGNRISSVLIWGGVMILCAVFAVLGNIIANRMASAVARDATREIRNDLFSKITTLSNSQVDHYTESTLISRMTSDTYNIHNMIGRMQRLGVRAPILLIGGIIVTMTLDPVLSMILVISLPLLGAVVYIVSAKGIPLFLQQQVATDMLIRKVRESIIGIRVIKALSKTDYERNRFETINKNLVSKEKKASVIMAITNPVMNLMLNIGLVLIIIVGAARVDSGLTAPGKIIAFLTYFTIILNAMLTITKMFVMFSKAAASAGRIDEILKSDIDLQRIFGIYEKTEGMSAEDQINEDKKNEYAIEFENVTFSYNKTHNNLENISFKLKKGGAMGIIGATGAGKTTIVNLMMRFYDPDDGTIRVNGRDVREYEKTEFYSMFGSVFQNDTIFEDSVYENISLGRDISPEEVEKASRYAQILEHINRMKNGFDADIAIKGANLSGGQKQRLLIARALAGNPKILLLDDSSSALDYRTDAQVRNEIKQNYPDTTTVIVAQRVSSVMNSDLILVIDEGKVAGIGTHMELMMNCAEYREISRLQLGTE